MSESPNRPPLNLTVLNPEPADARWFVRPKTAPVNCGEGRCCGAALIDARYAVTAAHCAGCFQEGASVVIGSAPNTWEAEIERICRAPGFPSCNGHFPCGDDLMLLRLSDAGGQPIAFSRDAHVNDEPHLYGWDCHDLVMKVTRSSNPATIHQLSGCQGGVCKSLLTSVQSDAGGGDSGGPLVLDGPTPQLLGVLSGRNSATARDVYVHVGAHRSWIQQVLATADPWGAGLCAVP